MSNNVHIIFDGPPSNESGRFIEVENDSGASIKVGEWKDRGDGTWALVIDMTASKRQKSIAWFEGNKAGYVEAKNPEEEGVNPYDTFEPLPELLEGN